KKIYLFIYLFIYCIQVHCCCLQTHQKRVSDPITDGCELPCGCWELNSGPLEEQSVLLTAEPFLQPRGINLFRLDISNQQSSKQQKQQ
ncbi:mCG1045525, partial [Mus musculus]